MKNEKFIRLHNAVCGDDVDELADYWSFEHPDRPASYDTTIASNSSTALKSRKEAGHEEKKEQYNAFNAHEQVFKDRIEEA